jgi:hypothetical protein
MAYVATPKPDGQRRRRNAAPATSTVSGAGPKRPPALPGASGYPASVRKWYATWAKSPQAELFSVTDWQRLQMLAPLVAKFFDKPDGKLFSEIRQNESLLGATHVDRLRGRIVIGSEPAAGERSESSSGSRRDLRVVG